MKPIKLKCTNFHLRAKMSEDRFSYEVSREQWEMEHDPAYNKWLDNNAQWWADYDKTGEDMNINDMKESRYLKKEDVGDGVIATIAGLKQENLAMENQPDEMKWVMSFRENLKPMVMNSTNAQLCAKALNSPETDDWTGKQVILFNDPNVSFGGKLTGGIRIRKNQQAAPVPAAPATDLSDSIPF